eukprot:830580-Prymnesium_polylepis.1
MACAGRWPHGTLQAGAGIIGGRPLRLAELCLGLLNCVWGADASDTTHNHACAEVRSRAHPHLFGLCTTSTSHEAEPRDSARGSRSKMVGTTQPEG